MVSPVRIGILSVTTSTGATQARRFVVAHLTERLAEGWELVEAAFEMVSQSELEDMLRQWVDVDGLRLILTLGGIGPGKADVVPEATLAVCPKPFAGFGEQIRRLLLPIYPMASGLRLVTGIRHQSLIVNLPAEPAMLAVCLPTLFPAIPNAVFLASGVRIGR